MLRALARLVVFALGPALLIAQDRRPNILFIYSDDHAAHALSCYGSTINVTPNLDRLATEGMRFANCFATNAICGPARASVLTGKYSHRNGFARNEQTFDGDQWTFPKALRTAGYATALIGKWHLSSDPQGFDHWSILPGQGLYHDPWFLENGERRRLKGYVTDLITSQTLAWLERWRTEDRAKDKPFLLMCQHKAPHRNWQPAERHAQLFADQEIPLPATFDDDWSQRSAAAAGTTMTIERHLTENDVKGKAPDGLDAAARKRWLYQRYIKDYLRCIAAVDESVGSVLEWLDAHGLAEDTIVVYSSDQGFFLGDHGWYDKRFMYEEALRAPLLVRWPKHVAAGTTCESFVLNVDFAPSFLELAHAELPADLQGRSITPLLRGATPADWRRSMYYRYYEYPDPHDVRPHFGVRTERHKLIRFPDLDAWELFDLSADPHELVSRHDDPAYATVRAELELELARLQAELGDDGTVHDPRLARFAAVTPQQLGRWAADEAWQFPSAKLRSSPRDVDLDVSAVPFSFGAKVVRRGAEGVLAACGGSQRGYALWLERGVPHFAIRNGRELRAVRGPTALPEGRETLVVGALANDGMLRLFVDGTAVAEAPGFPLDGLPTEGLSLGVDAETAVTDARALFNGTLRDVRLWRGTVAHW
ncbi:MAG: sulfatase-like hydrolase/transferase [Planctomycetes bacterium]|nr:sulfatase-like hydrolase/transferase [Planctomycetota bacterium]